MTGTSDTHQARTEQSKRYFSMYPRCSKQKVLISFFCKNTTESLEKVATFGTHTSITAKN